MNAAVFLAAVMCLLPSIVRGQTPDPRVPRIAEAEALFEQAVAAFEDGRYTDASGQFSQVAKSYGLHLHTTAAALMEAKTLYRIGAYDRAARAFDDFLRAYPTSSYVAEAERGQRLASQAEQAESNRVLTLGIVLSLSEEEASQTQAVFNGIRLAVDANNQRPDARPVRMLFRDIDELGPAGAVRSAVESGAQIIVGALFSDQARAAARAAEEAQVTFVAPLATDPEVTESRRFAFQANPSIPARGRLMARFAINGLRMRELAVVAESDEMGISREMGLAFAEEARTMGADVQFVRILPNSSGWFRIGAELSADSLRRVDALYAPMAGDRADRLAGALLSGLDGLLGTGQANSTSPLRILGNAEWHNLPLRGTASRYRVTYSNDYFFAPESDRAQAFVRRYRTLSGSEPNRLAVVGYDLATYVLGAIRILGHEDVRNAIATAPPFEGIGVRIHFEGAQVNRSMYYHRYRDGTLELVR